MRGCRSALRGGRPPSARSIPSGRTRGAATLPGVCGAFRLPRAPVAARGRRTPRAPSRPRSPLRVPSPAVAGRPSSQPRQNPERWNRPPGAPRRPLGMLRRQAGSPRRAARAPRGALPRPRGRLPSAERAHDGGGGERERRQQRRRGRQQQQRHVQHRRGGADAAPLPDVRRRRRRLHQQVPAGCAAAAGASRLPALPLTLPLLPSRPNFPQVAQKLPGKVGCDSERASPAGSLRPRGCSARLPEMPVGPTFPSAVFVWALGDIPLGRESSPGSRGALPVGTRALAAGPRQEGRTCSLAQGPGRSVRGGAGQLSVLPLGGPPRAHQGAEALSSDGAGRENQP